MKQCKQGYYYCYTDEVCKPIPKGLRVTARFSGGGKEPEETGIDVPTNGNGDGNGGGDGGGGMGESNILEKLDGKSAKDKGYSLRDWFKGGGWKQAGGKYDGKPCAKQPGQTTKPYCRDPDDRAAMSKDERDKRAAKKRKEDPNPDRKGKAKIVTQKNSFEPEGNLVDEGKKDACYKKVKASAKVWPSAYASGRLVQCRKKGAANYGNKSESVEFSNWRDDFQATEYEFIDIIKAEPLISEGAMPDAIDPKAHRTAQRTKKIRDRTKTGDEGSTIAKKKLRGPSLPMEEVETVDEGQKCWKGYEKKGTKKMFGKVVNNCVKKEEFVDEAKDDTDIGEKTGEKVPRKNISDANRYKMEKRRRENLKKRPGDTPGDSKLIQALRSKAKETGNYAEEKEESKIDGSNLKKLVAKAVRRVDADVDGDVDTDDMKSSETGEFVPSPDGKKKLKPKVRFEGASDWRNELDEGWKSALAGAGVAAALMSQGGQKAPDKKTTTSPSRSNTERVSKTTQKKLSPMDQWRKNHPKLANKSDNPPEFKRKKLSPINKDWAKANPKLAEKEKDNRSKLGEGAAWTKKSGKNKEGGLNEKGRKSYEAENPGSDLKAPSKKKGNKRRASFCARMKGMKKKLTSAKTARDPDSRINKSLRAWNC